MKYNIILTVLAASAWAAPLNQGVSLTQDSLGNYNLNIKTEDLARIEEGSENGNVVGSYTFTDKEGVVHTVKYIATDKGFRAEGDLPVPVQDTPEVAAARAAHLAAVKREKALLPEIENKSGEGKVFVPIRLSAPIAGRQISFSEQTQQVAFAEPPRPRQISPEATKNADIVLAAPHQGKQIDFSAPHQGANFEAKSIAVDNAAEIAAAKAFHFAAHQEALDRLSAVYKEIASA